MDIVKRLSLNKTPKDVENNSIVAAKNIMVDNTGSFITNEHGFNIAFDCPNDGEFIVGCIPCTEEIVIFTYSSVDGLSRVYRYYDEGFYTQCDTGWKYSGGKIIGTYTYNYRKDLIIAVAEYDAYDIYGNKLLVPLRSWNLNDGSSSFSYSTEETIPKINAKYIVNTAGSLLCGVYTFFIRFKIGEQSFTKWFQITDDIIILNIVQKEGINHEFMLANNSGRANIVTLTNVENFKVNDDQMSSNSIILDLDFDKDCTFSEYQIGYLYKRKSDLVARIKSTYSTATKTISIVDNDFIEETTVDELVESPHQFYNVKSLINYNNRLYIANYDEYRNENLQTYANKVKVDIITAESSSITDTIIREHFAVQLSVGINDAYGTCSVYIKDVDYYKENGEYYIKNPREFIKQYIAKSIWLPYDNGKATTIDKPKYYNFIKDNKIIQDVYNFNIYVLDLARYNSKKCLFSTEGSATNYKIKIVVNNNDNYLQIITNTGDVFNLKHDSSELGSATAFNIDVHLRETVNATTNEMHFWYFRDTPDPTELTGGIPFIAVPTLYTTTQKIKTENKYNTNKTLIPNQVYAFYVHFIRPDYSVTDGFKLTAGVGYTGTTPYEIVTNNNGDKLFKIKNNPSKPLVFPIFSNLDYPKTYIGCFISYEDVETTVIPVTALSLNDKIYEVTNTNYIFDDGQIVGITLRDFKVDGADRDITDKTIVRNQLIHPNVKLTVEQEGPNINNILGLISKNENIYSKAGKKLYRLTNNIFGNASNQDDAYMYLPGFYNEEKIIYYDKTLIIAPSASNVMDGDGHLLDRYTITLKNNKTYSTKPLDAYTVNQDYAQGAVSLVDNEGHAQGVFYNKVLSPDKLKDFLQLPQCYKAKPDKIYTNYSRFHSDVFTKTIYRSNVISDESLSNGFREFVASNYKNIFENKGDIINIVGIGLYLIIHTQYSMFVFDRSPKLTHKSQLDIPDVFDISYQEVMPSNEGFGGLSDREEAILTKHGYFWFDKINKYIFTYENGTAKIISQDINNFLRGLDINTVRFAEDIINNRLIICIYLTDYSKGGENPILSITLSYSFITNTFISLHDYTFTHNFRTYNQSYMFDENKDRKRLYIFDKNEYSYMNLGNDTGAYYPEYHEETEEEHGGQDIRPWIPEFN